MSDFLVLGGGVIGMMLARELADAGADVTLVERGECARESSWAGGGIVSPLYPWRYPSEITALAAYAQQYYPDFARQLLEETGVDPEFREDGLLFLRVADQQDALDWSARNGNPLEAVDASFLYEREPDVAPGFREALWMPGVASVRNPRLGQALKASLQKRSNIRILEHTEVRHVYHDEGEVLGVEGKQMVFSARRTILCAGAWTGKLLQELGVETAIKPVRGQMILFKAPPGLLNRVVLMDGRYLIPRNDGRILAGSTLEYVGFDKHTTDDALVSLRETAYQILPRLRDYEVEHHWAGLRPGSVDGIPLMGEVPGYRNLFVSAGHFRNGLVLAPAATRVMADLLLKREPQIDPLPYSPAFRSNAS
ncbi:glycine oxidase ThiO [Marinospirillum alkaliphilum]|uniref:Glycine oxidase n=1 Tax=Marinospirillum alkaliphilum DSM 21637 TaxID=1122209 RepID=A0A1K1ZQ40_9GAMM|nr:glycine oxidase ThiO [Marinospirillum alkaliphilum]SFX75843.1 glycine oxidase [Marinospirillum alkaliphilum DSM 21637]